MRRPPGTWAMLLKAHGLVWKKELATVPGCS